MRKFYKKISVFLLMTMLIGWVFQYQTIWVFAASPYDENFGDNYNENDGYNLNIFSETFESSSLGAIAPNTSRYKYDSTDIFITNRIEMDQNPNQGKVLMMAANKTGTNKDLTNLIGNAYTTVTNGFPIGDNQLNHAKIQVDIKFENYMNAQVSLLTYTTNQFVAIARSTSDGKIQLLNYNGTTAGYDDVCDYELNQWYSFVFYLDSETATYTAYCNNQLLGKGFKWGPSARNGIRHFRVNLPNVDQSTDATLFVDNLMISTKIIPDVLPTGYDSLLFYDDFDGNYTKIDGLTYSNNYYERVANSWEIQPLKDITNDAELDSSYKNDAVYNQVMQVPRCVSTSQNGYMGIAAGVFRAQYPDEDGKRLKHAMVSFDFMTTTNKNFSIQMHNYPSGFPAMFTVANGIVSLTGTVTKSSRHDMAANIGLNTWNRFTFFVDTDAKNVILYVNGILMGSSRFTTTELLGMDRLRIAGVAGEDVSDYIYLDNFEVRTLPKMVLQEEPVIDGIDDVNVLSNTFEFTMSNEIRTAGGVTVTKNNGEPAEGYEVNTQGKTLSVVFDDRLDFDTAYTITLADVVDIYGQSLSSVYRYSFITMKEGIAASSPRFTNAAGGNLMALPASGTVKATASAENPFGEEKEALLVVGVYDGEGNMQLFSADSAIIAAYGSVNLTASVSSDNYSGCAVKAFVIDDLVNLNLLSGDYSVLTQEGSKAAQQEGKGTSAITQGKADLDGEFLTIKGTLSPAAKRSVLVSISDEQGNISMMPLLTDENGVYSIKHHIQGNDGKYSIKVTGRSVIPAYNATIFYTSEATRGLIYTQVNQASSVGQIKELLELYKTNLNLEDSIMIPNSYQTLYEQKPFTSYSQIREVLISSYELLQAINNSDWSVLGGIITDNHEIILHNNSYSSYYGGLTALNQNKISQVLVKEAPFASFLEFRTAFSKAVQDYQDGLKDNSGGSQGGGGYGSGSNSKASYLIEETGIAKNLQDGEIFRDLEEVEWAKESILSLYERGILSGDGNKTFRPLDSIKREEFVKLLVEGFSLQGEVGQSFADVSEGTWYQRYLAIAKEAGIVSGYADGTFGVGQNISRQDMAVMIGRAAQFLGKNIEKAQEVITFTDDEQIGEYAKEAVYQMQQAGILSGVGEGLFAPLDHANRAQAAKMIYNLVVSLGGEEAE